MNIVRCDKFIGAAKAFIDASRNLRGFGVREAKSALSVTTLALKAAGYSQDEIAEMAEHVREDLGEYPDQVFARLAGRELDQRPWLNWARVQQN